MVAATLAFGAAAPVSAAVPGSAEAARPAKSLPDAKACRRFSKIAANFRLTDTESAKKLYRLAAMTGNSTLALEIEEVADAFARGDASIPSSGVMSLCS